MPPRVAKTKKAPKPTATKEKVIEDKINSDSASSTIIQRPQPKKPADFPVDPKNNNARYWLIKSEPLSRIDPKTNKDVRFSLADLAKVEYEQWDGVRNHEAKNNMLNMSKDDILLFHHSNTPTPGIVGEAKVYNEAHPDSSQFDPKSNYYDSKSTKESPRWWCVDVSFVRRFKAKVSLVELRENEKLSEMVLVKRGRLSVTPVRKEEYYEIKALEESKEISDDIDCDLDPIYI